jgi:hypothetical protein
MCCLELILGPKTDDEAGNSECLRHWRLTNPREDKDRILSSKDPLLQGSCTWVFHDRAFTEWWNNEESRMLWIHGHPGKGKTMMMMALIDEVSWRLKSKPGSGILSYFFCQNTTQELSSAVNIIRGLTYLLAKENPPLTRHLRKKYDEAGSRLFDGLNALYALWATLSEMVQDANVPRVYLMVDALDECDSRSLEDFLRLVTQDESKLSSKVKWVVTSRNETRISEHLQYVPDTSLELNSSYVSEAVKSFINFRVNELTSRKKYRDKLQRSIKEYLTHHADGTFLWVALVCKELEKVSAWRTPSIYRKFPAGLESLYQRMVEQIHHDKDSEEVEVCIQILCTVTIACRPLHLNEIGVIAGLPEDLYKDSQALQGAVGSCGSFLEEREQIVYFVHQSAKDYFSTGNGSSIFPSGQIQAHTQLASRSLRLMEESLKTDICYLQMPGSLLQEVEGGKRGSCLPLYVQYACCYWARHLKQTEACLRDDDQVRKFLQKHLLHWLEALSLIGKMSDSSRVLADFQHMVSNLQKLPLYSYILTPEIVKA